MRAEQLRWRRTLNCEHLEARRLLASDFALSVAGDVAADGDVVVADEQQDPPTEQSRLGLAWDSGVEEASTITAERAASDIADAMEQDDPPTTRERTRTSGDIGDGAQQRPGRGWDAAVDETHVSTDTLVAATATTSTPEEDPLTARHRGRTSADLGSGAQKRPGRGWDDISD